MAVSGRPAPRALYSYAPYRRVSLITAVYSNLV
jgi:hypothetical protein